MHKLNVNKTTHAFHLKKTKHLHSQSTSTTIGNATILFKKSVKSALYWNVILIWMNKYPLLPDNDTLGCVLHHLFADS